jgi:hypothetical protein
MQMLYRRYTRSGRAGSWFYALIGSGFVSLAVIAGVRGEWLAMAIAIVMVAVTLAASRLLRRVDADLRGREGRDHV